MNLLQRARMLRVGYICLKSTLRSGMPSVLQNSRRYPRLDRPADRISACGVKFPILRGSSVTRLCGWNLSYLTPSLCATDGERSTTHSIFLWSQRKSGGLTIRRLPRAHAA